MSCTNIVVIQFVVILFFFFFSSRRRHTRCREVSWARRCVQETDITPNSNKHQSQHQITYPVSYTHLTLPTILLVQISVVAVSLKKKKESTNTIIVVLFIIDSL
eukprot:TRINITY_DN22747_c0_g1_i3.p3 TRINITY_DN22747_c0_g1~~TRINITY_DN22747_c0_g1_i3.p3  ORF type:complete len:104 (-),score=39.16 TRINITY_DN22747_c0_g1_i3:54-365(-)